MEVATEVVTACVLVGTAATRSSLHAHYTPTTPTRTPAMFAAPTTTRYAAPGRKWSSSAGGRSGGISGKGSGGSGDGDRERGSWLELEIVIATVPAAAASHESESAAIAKACARRPSGKPAVEWRSATGAAF